MIIMLYNDIPWLQCYTIIYHDYNAIQWLQWYTMITMLYNDYNAIQWYTMIIMIYNAIQCYTMITMIYNAIQCYTMLYNAIQCYTMTYIVTPSMPITPWPVHTPASILRTATLYDISLLLSWITLNEMVFEFINVANCIYIYIYVVEQNMYKKKYCHHIPIYIYTLVMLHNRYPM